MEHRGRAVSGLKVKLTFKWQGGDVAFKSTVMRSSVVRDGGEEGPVSQSAIVFDEGLGDAEEKLKQMMSAFIAQLMEAHRANATGVDDRTASILNQIGQARRSRSQGLVAYRWNGKQWSKAPTKSAKQPNDGFTVAAYEDEEELTTLCQTYEQADEEGRRMIRLVAELSVRSATTK
ncbi:MAG TPA: hypothetical protein VF057_06410 [Thermoanaerobaculia bacterium]